MGDERPGDQPATSGIPIIVLTAIENREHYPGLMADELPRMPFHLRELLAAVAGRVDASRVQVGDASSRISWRLHPVQVV